MSIEVASQKFLFTPSVTLSLTRDELWKLTEGDVLMARTQTTVPFSHNHLHDLESLWWVALWVVMYNNFSKSEATTSGDRPDRPPFRLTDAQCQLGLAEKLFSPNLVDHRDVFIISEEFQENYNKLPINKKPIYQALNYLRELLIMGYEDIEKTYPQSVDPTVLNSNIYKEFKNVFSSYGFKDSNYTLDFIPEIYETLSNPKRPRSESTNDTELGAAAQKSRRKY